jgi:hypothetical protein
MTNYEIIHFCWHKICHIYHYSHNSCFSCFLIPEILSAIIPVQAKQLSELLDEDPTVMERRQQCFQRLELYKAARDEIDSVSWVR